MSAQAAGTTAEPHLQTVVPHSGFLALAFTVGDLVPVQVQVASGAPTPTPGVFAASRIKLHERMNVSGTSSVLHWRTQTALPPGVYAVRVSAMLSDGFTSCIPRNPSCSLRWSNVVRVTIPR